LAHILKLARELKEYFFDDINISEYVTLEKYFSHFYCNKSIETAIFTKIIDENTIDDKASGKLYEIRTRIRKIETEIKEKLNFYIRSAKFSKYIQESIITIKNDRFVIPVKEEFRGQMKGFIHDVSSSGSTLFIEPIAVFELNNDLNRLKVEELDEIEAILKDLSDLFFPIMKELENNVWLIGKLDFIFAKAKYSIQIEGISPIIQEQKIIYLEKARHPLISPETVVPIDITIGDDFSCLVITGPNTGGKTVTLKTVGLLTCMAMSRSSYTGR